MFCCKSLEFEGLIGTGDTCDEEYKDVREDMESYTETKIVNGIELPLPINSTDYSGKFAVRLPKTLLKLLSKKQKKKECL